MFHGSRSARVRSTPNTKLPALALDSPASRRAIEQRNAILTKYKSDTMALVSLQRDGAQRDIDNSWKATQLKKAIIDEEEQTKSQAAYEAAKAKIQAADEAAKAKIQAADEAAKAKSQAADKAAKANLAILDEFEQANQAAQQQDAAALREQRNILDDLLEDDMACLGIRPLANVGAVSGSETGLTSDDEGSITSDGEDSESPNEEPVQGTSMDHDEAAEDTDE